MNVVFAHDHIFYKYLNKYYSNGGLSYDVLARYLEFFDEMKIISRQNEIKQEFNGLTIASGNNIKFIKIPNFKSIKTLSKIFIAQDIIKKVVRDSNCVIARLPSATGSLAIKYAKEFNKPYLVEVVGCVWDSLWNHSIKGKILAPYSYIKMKRAVKDAPYVLYVSKDFLQTRYPSNGMLLGCSDVSLQPINNSLLEERLCKIEQISNDMPIVLGTIAGVGIRYKGQQYVIQAISRLNKIGHNFEYFLVGGGDQKYLKTVARKFNVESKVKFLGSLPHEEVFEFIKNIDVYIQPSNAESHGRVIVEAMSMACPVIGSSTGGIPELVSPEFVFKRKNVRDLEEKIKKMTKEKMIDESIRSFEKAKEFDKDLLDNKRNSFYLRFKNSQI